MKFFNFCCYGKDRRLEKKDDVEDLIQSVKNVNRNIALRPTATEYLINDMKKKPRKRSKK